MMKVCCIAVISAVITMSGCAIDSIEDQEGASGVQTIESEISGTVQLIVISNNGGSWQWIIQNTTSTPASRRVVFENFAVGQCRTIAANSSTIVQDTVVKPVNLTGCSS